MVAKAKPRHMGVPGLGLLVGKLYYAVVVGSTMAAVEPVCLSADPAYEIE